MTAGSYNFTIEQNTRFYKVLVWRDSTGALVNLSSFTGAVMKIWDVTTKNLILTLTTTPDANGNVITLGGAAGTVTLLIKTATTTTMSFREATYKLRINDASSEGDRLLQGTISFSKESA
jgi:hypothetical protein